MLATLRDSKKPDGPLMDMKARHPTLGTLLGAIRSRHGWTLKEMSERTDIPVSTLSKVEHDRLTLTYDKLLQVSQKLNMSLSELLSDPGGGPAPLEPAVTARRSIGLVADALRINTGNYDYYYLCAELRKKRMIPALIRIRAKSLEEFGELVRHPGEEYVYVLEGSITVHTEFYDPVVIKSGESIYVDSNMGHAYVAEGCDEATVLGVCSSSEEGLMESLMSLHGGETAVRRAEPAKRLARQPKPRKR
jgi:transcriptional regulator with XRE-family HTH domain